MTAPRESASLFSVSHLEFKGSRVKCQHCGSFVPALIVTPRGSLCRHCTAETRRQEHAA